jgi:hypothetical protein
MDLAGLAAPVEPVATLLCVPDRFINRALTINRANLAE